MKYIETDILINSIIYKINNQLYNSSTMSFPEKRVVGYILYKIQENKRANYVEMMIDMDFTKEDLEMLHKDTLYVLFQSLFTITDLQIFSIENSKIKEIKLDSLENFWYNVIMIGNANKERDLHITE
jgi:hypothetical protein